jgi:hypothetical protein
MPFSVASLVFIINCHPTNASQRTRGMAMSIILAMKYGVSMVFLQLYFFLELDDGKIYRKPLYLMVKTMVSP